jgi:hypothetical protein
MNWIRTNGTYLISSLLSKGHGVKALLLCTAWTLGVLQCVRSYSHIDSIGVGHSASQSTLVSDAWLLGSHRGGFNLSHVRIEQQTTISAIQSVCHSKWYLIANAATSKTVLYPAPLWFASVNKPAHGIFGFRWGGGRVGTLESQIQSGFALVIPYWFVGLILLLLTARACGRWHKVRTTYNANLRGLCIHCGYDLRASVMRCPECGKDVAIGRETSDQEPR